MLASFQGTVIEELLGARADSAEEIGAQSVIISGGVACNSGLRIAAGTLQAALSGVFPDAIALYRQRSDDRRCRLPQASP